jgi:hypothetical protein
MGKRAQDKRKRKQRTDTYKVVFGLEPGITEEALQGRTEVGLLQWMRLALGKGYEPTGESLSVAVDMEAEPPTLTVEGKVRTGRLKTNGE